MSQRRSVQPLGAWPKEKTGPKLGFRHAAESRELTSFKLRFRRWALQYWPEAVR